MNRLFPGLLLALALLLGGCGAPAAPISFDTSATAIVLEETTGGGMSPTLWRRVDALPVVRLYGDGRLIYRSYDAAGAMRWMEARLTAAETSALVRDVVGPNREFCNGATINAPAILDAPSTTLRVQLSDQTCQANVPALGMDGERAGLSRDGAILLRQIEHANQALASLNSPTARPLAPAQVTLAVEPGEAFDQTIEWAFPAVAIQDGATISGPDAAAVLAAAPMPISVKDASGAYYVVALPVLP
jgi:hypothetical protein